MNLGFDPSTGSGSSDKLGGSGMNVGFDTPVRIHWRLPRGGDEAVAAALREGRPLALAAEAERAQDLACLHLPWEGTAVTWIFSGWRSVAGTCTVPRGVGRVELPVEEAEEAEEAFARFPARIGGAALALRAFPRPSLLISLPVLLAAVSSRGWGMTIPSLPATGHVVPRPALDRAAARAAAAFTPGLLAVHDFFLSAALGLAPCETAGCEAGDALAFVDEGGRVFACASLPVPLGKVPAVSLAAAWAGEERTRLREALALLPGPCAPCPDLARCRGGCRGLARQAHGDFSHPDPFCPRAGGAR